MILGSKPVPDDLDPHLTGDNALPLTPQIMVPYKAFQSLTTSQQNYNEALARCREVVDTSHAILKGKFRRLTQIDNTNMALIANMIVACCVLHNMNLLEDDHVEFESEEHRKEPEANEEDENVKDDPAGIHKRDRICESF